MTNYRLRFKFELERKLSDYRDEDIAAFTASLEVPEQALDQFGPEQLEAVISLIVPSILTTLTVESKANSLPQPPQAPDSPSEQAAVEKYAEEKVGPFTN